MIRVSLGDEHLAEVVCFVKARLPAPSTPEDNTNPPEVSTHVA